MRIVISSAAPGSGTVLRSELERAGRGAGEFGRLRTGRAVACRSDRLGAGVLRADLWAAV